MSVLTASGPAGVADIVADGLRLPIYLDHHATTPVDPRVAAVVMHHMTTAFGNASSKDHEYGDEADAAVAAARRHVATLLDASPRSVVFTSGATESLNLALQGFVRAQLARTGSSGLVRIALPPVEHPAVLEVCQYLADRGEASLRMLPVDGHGRIDLEAVEYACQDGIDLLVVMAANNEIGNLYPLAEIGAIARRHGIPFLTDATQAAGKVEIRVRDWGISMLALAGHKMYGPKGVGALIVDPDLYLEPLFRGGGHQRGLRSGTLNVPGIAGLGEACRLRAAEMAQDEPAIARRRDRLQASLVDSITGLMVSGDLEHRLAGNLHISVPDVPSSAVVAQLRGRVALARGSACASSVDAPSHVLTALGFTNAVVRGSLRIGLGRSTTDTEIEVAGKWVSEAVTKIRHSLR
ncbi:MAG TPA: cysteine desulfurase family protein [Longimicrobium sp.]|jgi:cysteine desulfurase